MILVRSTFQVKFGQMNEVLTLIKEAADTGTGIGDLSRVLTDASGQMFTLVIESKVESIDAFRAAIMAPPSDPKSAENMQRMLSLCESGRNEYYTIEWEA